MQRVAAPPICAWERFAAFAQLRVRLICGLQLQRHVLGIHIGFSELKRAELIGPLSPADCSLEAAGGEHADAPEVAAAGHIG